MEMLAETLAAHPLVEGQRVLALTFMHGARRRLADRLRTVDGFAWRIFRRWRGLAVALNLPSMSEGEFDEVCNAAGILLEQPQVRDWAAASFPIVLVDEGQDLRPQRLRMLAALSASVRTLVAADEFQCLDQDLRPNPLVAWLREVANPQTLIQIHRTNVAGLLAAAAAIRGGKAPVDGRGFRILPPGVSIPLAATLLANAIAWRPMRGNVAVISPALQGGYAQNVVRRVGEGPCGKKHQNGPYPIHWEDSNQSELNAILDALELQFPADGATTIAALQSLPPSGAVGAAIVWVNNQIHACGREEFRRAEIDAVIGRNVNFKRQHGQATTHRYTALTVQQAKNREFDGVVVLWPYQVGGDDEHKRRLLYNAITRARHWCNVIVQGQNILNAPPFA